MSYHLKQDKKDVKKTFLRLIKLDDALVNIQQELQLIKTIDDRFWDVRIECLKKERKILSTYLVENLYYFQRVKEKLKTRIESERKWLINQ